MVLGIEILLAAAVLLAVGLAAAGRVDGMSRAVPDAPPGLPPGPVTPQDLREVQIPVVLRGYRMADVDHLLERAALELQQAQAVPETSPDEDGRPTPNPYWVKTQSPESLSPETLSQDADVDG